jgi:DNA-directed RNA polymerase subunit alpha
MPKRLVKEDTTATTTYAKFVAEPFETGFGHTVGNSLRRVLLSSLEGAAITSVKIDGAMHEFTTVDGVVEDVTDIILNLKRIKFKSHNRDPQTLLLSVSKEGPVNAEDIQLNQNVELVNGDQLICTLDRKKKLEMEFEIKCGRGFCPGDENKKQDQPIGVIAIDSLFSPVSRGALRGGGGPRGSKNRLRQIESLRFGRTGGFLPDDALTQASAILQHHLDVFRWIRQERG